MGGRVSERWPVQRYRDRILEAVSPAAPVRLPLSEALGCVCAGPVRAPIDLAPFASSAMDGFAVRAADVAPAPADLALTGQVRMGRPAGIAVGPGEAVAVATGGAIPAGADTVVPVEMCLVLGSRVTVLAGLPAGSNIRPEGQDLRCGELAIASGTLLEPLHIGLLGACGASQVVAVPRPRVGIVSTGDELVPGGGQIKAGQIYDCNSHLLGALVRAAGGVAVQLGCLPDDPAVLLEALEGAAGRVDVLVCTGGVSAGSNDPLRRAFPPGSCVDCVNVAMQPGRPQAFGNFQGTPLFGLPGNPQAAFVSFHLFVAPALARMRGLPSGDLLVPARLDGCLEGSADRTRFLPGSVRNAGGTLFVTPLPPAGSSLLTPLAGANCLIELAPGSTVAQGEVCRMIPIGPLFQ